MLFIVTDLCIFMLLFLLLKIIYCVLFTLRDNLFECSHSIISLSSSFIISIKVATSNCFVARCYVIERYKLFLVS